MLRHARARAEVVNIRRISLGSVSGMALMLAAATPVLAQSGGAQGVEQVVVSSTRIQSAGFDAPTPTTVIDASFINKTAEPNIFDTVTQLPDVQGSTGTSVGTTSAGSGAKGVSALNLRGLGTIRTLVTLDSQRVVAADFTGINDVSEFPQLLVQRVDVVTGGASASYGSDAIAGVVNFVTMKKFEGFKGDISGGISTYGDNQTGQIRLAAGSSFLSGRGHVEGSVEYTYDQGVPGAGYGVGNGPNGRTWYSAPGILTYTIAATPVGSPQIVYSQNTQSVQVSQYGLITAGPLQGIAFGANGQPYNFRYGLGANGLQGVPAKNAAGTVTNCVSGLCIGGDNSGNNADTTSLVAASTRGDGYMRASYDIGQSSEIYGTVLLSEVWTQSKNNGQQAEPGNLKIQCDNAFLPPSITAACATNNITSFAYGVDSTNLTPNVPVSSERNLRRFVVGSDGGLDILGQTWAYDLYYEHGESDSTIHSRGLILNPHLNAAIDAVTGPNGTIVCRSPVAQANGCVPLNIIGNVPPTAAALAYVEPPAGEFSSTAQAQDAVSVVLNGEPFSLWAGPVALATGVEYRQEQYTVVGDPYGAGVSAQSPYNSAYPADPLVSTAGANWFAGNFHDGGGNYHVNEGFVELGLPIINDGTWGKADLNLAGRATGYSTSGYVQTWKMGFTWATPLDGVKLRGVMSRDVRAPNLSELFSPPILTHQTVINDATSTQAISQVTTLGNTNLKPEKSQTTELGIVFQPSWFPGFSGSVDYWRVAVKGQISTLTAQQEIDTCFNSANASPVCSAVKFDGVNNPITLQAFNLASTTTDGFDFEASYQFSLEDWGVPGEFGLRSFVTHTSKFITVPGIFGVPVSESAGANTGNTPLWKTYTTEQWNNDDWTIGLTERWFSDGVFNPYYIVCTVGCPAPTIQYPTTNYNHMQGAFYLDLGVTYNVSSSVEVYGKVDNLTNLPPAASSNGNGSRPGAGFNPELYDPIGRMFHLGVRFEN